MKEINAHKILGVMAGLVGLVGFEVATFIAADEVHRARFAEPLKRVVDANNDQKVDYYYPNLQSWAIQRDNNKFDICYLVPSGGQAVLATRDKKQSYLPLGNLLH